MSTATFPTDDVHSSLSTILDAVEEAFAPIVCFRRILDGSEEECRPATVAIVLESLTDRAKAMLERHVQDVLDRFPRDEEAHAAYLQSRQTSLEAWKVNDLAYDDAEFREALATAMKDPARLKEALRVLNEQNGEEVPAA